MAENSPEPKPEDSEMEAVMSLDTFDTLASEPHTAENASGVEQAARNATPPTTSTSDEAVTGDLSAHMTTEPQHITGGSPARALNEHPTSEPPRSAAQSPEHAPVQQAETEATAVDDIMTTEQQQDPAASPAVNCDHDFDTGQLDQNMTADAAGSPSEAPRNVSDVESGRTHSPFTGYTDYNMDLPFDAHMPDWDFEVDGDGLDCSTPSAAPETEAQPQLNLGSSVLSSSKSGEQSGKSKESQLMVQQLLREKFKKKQLAQSPAPPRTDDLDFDDADSAVGFGADDSNAPTGGDDSDSDFETAKTVYQRKKRAKTNTIEDDVAFLAREARNKARARKKEADAAYDRSPTPLYRDEESDLFVSAAPSTVFEDDADEPAPKRRGRKRKAPAPSEADSEPAARPSKPAKKGVAAAKRQPAKPKKATQAKGRKKNAGHDMTNLGSIYGSNVFADTNRTAHLGNQPKVQKTAHRSDALKNLVASLPVEEQKAALPDKRLLDKAIKDFTGQGCVKPCNDGSWSVKGMKSTLKHYQIMGVAFMRRRENGEDEPKGGILADDMGLGKTVMMLANIVNGKPLEKVRSRATLIVAAPALITQWISEIDKHCLGPGDGKHGIGTHIRFQPGSKTITDHEKAQLERADVVLVTYNEVAKSYPKAIVPSNLSTASQKDAWWREHYESSKGVLHQIQFHRIVLDEAHCIKNHLSHTSMACRAISAKHYWAITGTPVMNGIKEFYAYFKFLREPHTGSLKLFKENFCSPDDPDGLTKLNAFLQKLMIRRTHLTTMFNARLVDLPKPKELTLELEFNEVERAIYDIVKTRMVAKINALAKTATVNGIESQRVTIWTMILRLRQLCAHPLLIQTTVAQILEREDFEKLNRISLNEDAMGEESVLLLCSLRDVIKRNAGEKSTNPGLAGAVITTSESHRNGILEVDPTAPVEIGKKHGTTYRFRKYLDSFAKSEQFQNLVERSTCCSCRQKPNDPVVTSCSHIYCSLCIKDLQQYYARSGYDNGKCTECGEEYATVTEIREPADFDRTSDTRSPASTGSSPTIGLGGPRGKKKKKDDALGDMEDWIGMSGEILPSAKTRACKAQLLEWFQQDPKCKVIVYTQFLPVVKIMERVCQTEGWTYVKYTGEMSHDSRNNRIQEFGAENPPAGKKPIQIMLASLRCGGLGLNLTMASRVLCIDPWWNQAVEQQAFCRVFRIGQTKETEMTRLIVRNSIDDAMMAMKKRKQMEIDEVMDSEASKKKLTFTEMMRLFGRVGEDEDGKPFIFPEQETDEHLRYRVNDSDDEDGFLGNEP